MEDDEFASQGAPAWPPGVAHALRTPLGALVLALDVVELPGIDEATRRDALEAIRRQAVRLAALIDRYDPAP